MQLQYLGVPIIFTKKWDNHSFFVGKFLPPRFKNKNKSIYFFKGKEKVITKLWNPEILYSTSTLVKLQGTPLVSVGKNIPIEEVKL